MKKLALILMTSLSISAIPAIAQETKQTYKDVSKLIDVWLEYEKDYKNIPFISGAIVDDQEIIWSGAFGQANVENSVTGNENTLSSVCSISKVFTATAIMRLVDERKIRLSDKMKDILPEFSVIQKFPGGGDITVQSLLSHTSGLPRDTNHSYWGGPDHPFPNKSQLFESLSTQATERPVGKEVGYSNVGYALLGQIIEHVTNTSYKNYVETHLFQPLGMSNSIVDMQSSLYGGKLAIGYSAPDRYGNRTPASFYQGRAMAPAMGISTTAIDLAKFAMWQFKQVDSPTTEIMGAKNLKSMYNIHGKSETEPSRGFGYVVNKTEDGKIWAMHGGVCPGYVSFFRMDTTNKRAYVFLASANKVNSLQYINKFVRLLDHADKITSTKQVNSTPELSQYTGLYDVSPWNSDYYVGKLGNKLVSLHFPVESLQWSLRTYQHVDGDNFQVLENGELINDKIHFIRNETGKIKKLHNMGNYHYKKTEVH